MGQVVLANIRKVVIFLPPTLGDCVNHLATLRWLRDGLPGREIVAVSSGLGLEVLRSWPVEGIELWDREGLWWKLFRGQFDLGLFPYVQNKMVRTSRLSRVKNLVGMRWFKNDDLIKAGIDNVGGEHQVLVLCRRMFGEVGVGCGQADFESVLAGLIEVKPDGQLVGFMTGASRSDKKWPLSKFRRTAEEMAKMKFEVWNFGGPDELDKLEDVATTDWAGTNLSFAVIAQHLSNLDILVTNDTGLMHLAGAAGTPVVGIFMAESPDEYYPPGTGHELLVGDVSVEEVLAAVDRIVVRQQ